MSRLAGQAAPGAGFDESSARKLLLVEAIESTDSRGDVVGLAERQQIDTELAAATGEGSAAPPVLQQRARHVLQIVEQRSPELASLQETRSWQRWMLAATPFAALLLGIAADRIANPHRVDLLSLPLLGIVVWNLALYVVLLLAYVLPRSSARPSLAAGLRRWAAGWNAGNRRTGNVRADATVFFLRRWYAVTAPLNAQRIGRVLHLSAAALGAGVAVSLLARGLVVEYRVGWESTFLGAGQVHAILRFLFAPVVALFSLTPFSVQEVERLRFDGPGGGGVAGARWVFLYASLLAVVVVVPRVVLAAAAFWRERALARAVPLDLDAPYYQQLIGRLVPARVGLWLVAPESADRVIMLRVLTASGESRDATQTLLRTARGDVLSLAVPAAHDLRVVPAGSTVLLLALGSLDAFRAALPAVQQLALPTLLLVPQPHGVHAGRDDGMTAQLREQALATGCIRGVLGFDAFARCWVQDRAWLDATARCLPASLTPGFRRLAADWAKRNQELLSKSMASVALQLVESAREGEPVRSEALSLRRINPADRHAHEQASAAAMGALVGRLTRSAALTLARLLELHGLEGGAAGPLEHRLEEKFVVRQAVNSPQAGLAGAATGAAMGASVDLMLGGLTLGAAAALGAFVGGTAAYVAAAWKNKAAPAGATTVQLGDEMMQAMVEASLLRYLAVVHLARGGAGAGDIRPAWKSEVVAAVEAHQRGMAAVWSLARAEPSDAEPAIALAVELEAIVAAVLRQLYPRDEVRAA